VPERLDSAVQRLKARSTSSAAEARGLASILDELRAKLPAATPKSSFAWITASIGKETRLILVEDVAYFKAEDKYTIVATAEGEALIRKSIRELLDVLDPAMFKQVHRSTIVNLRAIAGVARDESGRGTMRLKNRPETLAVSLTFMPLFRNM